MISHVWQVDLPNYTPTAQVTASSVKLRLSLSDVHCFLNLFNEIPFQKLNVLSSRVRSSLKIKYDVFKFWVVIFFTVTSSFLGTK
jgi:hypothetical protein